MRIHTDLTVEQVGALNAGLPTYYQSLSFHGSRTHARAVEVRLAGNGGRNNTGLYGAGDYNGATWDEWGAFFAALYRLDPTARCGGTAKAPVYADAEDYHFQTGDRFRNGMPEYTHPRHRWQYGAHGYRECSKAECDAWMPGWREVMRRREFWAAA